MATGKGARTVTQRSALAFEDRRYTLTELDALAAGLGEEMRDAGVVSGARVAVMSSNRPEFVVAMRAIWRLGAAAVLLSPAWKSAEVRHALALTGPTYALGDHPALAETMPMRHLDEPIASMDPGVAEPVDPRADAVLVFSSGTTGMPKAVRHTRASLGAAVRHWRDALGLCESDRIQVMTPPSHILGLLNIVTALDAGVWVRLHRRFDIDEMLAHIDSDRITVEMAVAPIALALSAHPRLESFDLSSLRYIVWGATPVTESVAEMVSARTGVRWVTAYGTSEVPVISCNDLYAGRLDTVGRVPADMRVRIVSLDNGEPLGPGAEGEVQVRSASVMAGYLPEGDTAGAFTDGWYRTGDVGSVDADGWLRITDRAKEMIKVRGFQVAPAEIEAVLHSHRDVEDCAVFGVPAGTDGEAIVAAVKVSTAVAPDELAGLVSDQLASYKRLSRVVIVDEIPRLPSGKVLRRVLKERLWTSA